MPFSMSLSLRTIPEMETSLHKGSVPGFHRGSEPEKAEGEHNSL